MDARLVALRRQYQFPGQDTDPDPALKINNLKVTTRHLILRQSGTPGLDHKAYAVDALFPKVIAGHTDTASIDEGSADLLYGLVRGLMPAVVLETGTHKGRSTRAIATALRDNAEITVIPHSYTAYLQWRGHVFTVDAEDHTIIASGAIPEDAATYVTPIVGWTPDVFEQAPLKDLKGIEFAFLDGDHTPEGLLGELEYVDTHRAPECLVAIDNSRDHGWPAIQQTMERYIKYPRISLGTCTGLDLIWMKG